MPDTSAPLTADMLRAIVGPSLLSQKKAEQIVPAIVATCRKWGITSKLQVAAFIAQCGHESGGFQWLEEFASGDAYEGRKDLGNTQPGDGRRFKGRGWIGITGRAVFKKAGEGVGLDLESRPELVSTPEVAALTAGWFWRKGSSRGDLNRFAVDATSPYQLGPKDTDRWNAGRARAVSRKENPATFDRGPIGFDMITLGINGGFNGKPQRDEYFERALKVLPDDPVGVGDKSPSAISTVASESKGSILPLLVVAGLAFYLWKRRRS